MTGHGRWGAAWLALLILAAPCGALAGPPFASDDPDPTDTGQWEVIGAATATWVHGGQGGEAPLLDVNWGAAPGLQLHVQPMMGFERSEGRTRYGVADLELGAKYRFVEDEGGWLPSIAVYPLITLPTGDEKRGLGAGETRAFLPIWVEKSIGRWTIYGGGGVGINPQPGGVTSSFVGVVTLYRVTEELQLGGEIFRQGPEADGERAAIGFNVGGAWSLGKECNLLFSAGRGLAHADSTNRFSGYLALQLFY